MTATDLVLSLGHRYGVGAIAWSATGDSNYNILFSLMNGYQDPNGAAFFNGSSGNGQSELGRKVWAAGHAKPSLGAFTGKLEDSHCPSAN